MKRHAATLLLAGAVWMPAASAMADDEAEIIAALHSQIGRCWVMPPETTSRTTPVTLTFRLGRDGLVQGVPTIVHNADVLEYGKVFVISASDAVRACQPYDLPADQYDIWKEVKITFRPPEN